MSYTTTTITENREQAQARPELGSRRDGRESGIDGVLSSEIPEDAHVVDVLRNGGTKRMAASAVGVTRETLMNWHNRGRQNVQDETPMNCYGAFYLHSERAMNEAKAVDLAAIREAG